MPMEKFAPYRKPGPVLFDHLAHLVQVAVPAGGSHHHVLARADASLDISQDSLRRREINHRIYIGEAFSARERGCVGIVRRA